MKIQTHKLAYVVQRIENDYQEEYYTETISAASRKKATEQLLRSFMRMYSSPEHQVQLNKCSAGYYFTKHDTNRVLCSITQIQITEVNDICQH